MVQKGDSEFPEIKSSATLAGGVVAVFLSLLIVPRAVRFLFKNVLLGLLKQIFWFLIVGTLTAILADIFSENEAELKEEDVARQKNAVNET